MTRRDILTCVHEPFGDAFYFGPERLSERYEDDEAGRKESGFENSTYKTIFDRLDKESEEVRYFFTSTACFVLSNSVPFIVQRLSYLPCIFDTQSHPHSRGSSTIQTFLHNVTQMVPSIMCNMIVVRFALAYLPRTGKAPVHQRYNPLSCTSSWKIGLHCTESWRKEKGRRNQRINERQ